MVGALSIVRFRTAIKDPMDLLFLFWSIGWASSAARACTAWPSSVPGGDGGAAGAVPDAGGAGALPAGGERRGEELEKAVLEAVQHHTRAYRVKSRNLSRGHMDLIVEVRVKAGGDLLREVAAIPSVEEASLLSHDGETTF